ncbi:YciI family protein [Roseibium sp. RKSG952]|uniref:YciI family protein n=1 Tax=Roseibium sp. RKSG952 TaxID=2529384 RepID=UPI0012BD6EC5|nr:YciI family protein [Roseibium sp. RKSG952]MTH99087.1 hypothetical protein [Roseibium sp. RKSG952]
MPKWTEYKQVARARGALALELYVANSVPNGPDADIKGNLEAHLAYQAKLERDGKLAFAGPLSDLTGEDMQGEGLIIYRAASLEEAKALAEADPMHQSGARTFTLRRWLVNEGSFSLSIGLSQKSIALT